MLDIFKKLRLLSLITATILTAVTLVALGNTKTSSTTSNVGCLGYITYSNQSVGSTNMVLDQPLNTKFNISLTNGMLATEVLLYAVNSNSDNEILIGRAHPVISTNEASSYWDFLWPIALWKNQTASDSIVNLRAKVSRNGQQVCTISTSISYTIKRYTTSAPILSVSTSSNDYVTNVGISNTQELKAKPASTITGLTDDNMIKYGVFKWSTENQNVGNISNTINNYLSGNSVMFNAGTTAGMNVVSVSYSYGGSVSETKKIPITIKQFEPIAKTDDSTTSSTTKTDTDPIKIEDKDQTKISTTDPITTSELTTDDQITSSKLEISDTTKTCIESGLNDSDRYAAIKSGESKPTSEELKRITNCFATSKYILPTNFSPVDPVKIDDLKTVENVLVKNLENTTKTTDAGNKETLKITGKATPNSKVFVYIFSDPLVITTTTDNDGTWQYTIEDPLVPGKHEVYAVVDKGDGTYERSDPLAFLISKASASAANPNGLSLKLGETPAKTPTQSQGNLILYVAGSILAIIIALIVLFLVLRSHNKHKLAVMKLTADNANQTVITTNPVQAINNIVPTAPVEYPVKNIEVTQITPEIQKDNTEPNHESQ